MNVTNVPLEKIEVGEYAQRVDSEDDGIGELAASIRRIGVLVPLIVRSEGDKYILIAGHRRRLAAVRVGLAEVPCIIRDSSAAESSEVAFAENLFRQDLSPVEMAAGIADCYKQGTLTIDQLAEGLHRSAHWVQAQIALLDWPADVLEAIHNGKISVSAASNLALVHDEIYRGFLVRQAVENGATARATAAWLQAWRSMVPPEEAVTREPVPAGERATPAVPQAPCIVCGNVFRTDELSHVPVCVRCIHTIRSIGDRG